MRRGYFLFFAFISVLLYVGCPNPSSGSGTSNASAPVITDVKVSSVSNILNPVWVTTLSANTKYYFFMFVTDKDLDISQGVMTFTDGTQTIGPQTIPMYGQTAVSDVFVGGITTSTAGTWMAIIYVVDSKGNKSNTKSITVQVQ
jgi:hypothetical protein